MVVMFALSIMFCHDVVLWLVVTHASTGQWNGAPVAIKTLNLTLEGDGEDTQQLMRSLRGFEKEVRNLYVDKPCIAVALCVDRPLLEE